MQSILAFIKSMFQKLRSLFSRKKDAPVDPTDPARIERPEPGPGEVVCYYGCPNSNKAKKLQLSKKAYR